MRKVAVMVAAALLSGVAGISSVLAAPVPADGTVYTLHTEGKEDKNIDTVLMVPLRDVAEKLGFKVTWEKGKTLVDNGKLHTTVTVGEDAYVIGFEDKDKKAETVSLGIPPALKNNVTYVPVTLFRSLLGNDAAVIELNGQTLTIFEKAPVTAPAEDKASTTEETKTPAAETTPAAEIANPFHDYTTLSDAEGDAGFSLSLPKTDASYTLAYRAMKGKLLEVIYSKEGTEAMRIRKGSDAGDVSGDYSTYPTIKTIVVDGINVRMKGNGNRMSLATWEDGGYSYSIHVDEAVTIADMMGMVREVK